MQQQVTMNWTLAVQYMFLLNGKTAINKKNTHGAVWRFFAQKGATGCTDQSEMWHGGPPECHRDGCKSVAVGPQRCKNYPIFE